MSHSSIYIVYSMYIIKLKLKNIYEEIFFYQHRTEN